MSIHEESTIAALGPDDGRLQQSGHVRPARAAEQPVLDRARPGRELDRATRTASALTFKLRQGVKWHDGKPFTAKDVKCTWELIAGNAAEKLRVNPRKSWYRNLEDGQRRRRSPGHLQSEAAAALVHRAAGLGLVAGLSLPRAAARHARCKPIGTGPFKFVEFKPNESIKVVAQPGLLEEGPALSRRDRIYVHRQPLDRDPGLRRRQFRPLCPGHPVAAADEAAEDAGAAGGVRDGAVEHPAPDARQSRQAAVRQRRAAPRDGADASTARPSSTSSATARARSAAR